MIDPILIVIINKEAHVNMKRWYSHFSAMHIEAKVGTPKIIYYKILKFWVRIDELYEVPFLINILKFKISTIYCTINFRFSTTCTSTTFRILL